MKGTVRIISGTLRGKVIPFLNSRFDEADITPQRVKGALFSILGENLTDKVFVDLFSGSGQIGVEALSRGAGTVVFNEVDRSRISFIRGFVAAVKTPGKSVILNLKAEEAILFIVQKGIRADIIFLDPPYDWIKGEAGCYSLLIGKIAEAGIMNPGGIIAVQHFSSNILPESCSLFTRSALKVYGTTSLSIYKSAENPNQPD